MKNIALVFGGKSCESEISTITALSAYKTIHEIYNVYPIFNKDNLFFLLKNDFNIKDIVDFNEKKFVEIYFSNGSIRFANKNKKNIPIYCVLNCCHGGNGENGNLAGYFETNGHAYTSTDAYASKIFMDKILTKEVLKNNNFSVLPYDYYEKGQNINLKNNYPIIIKPANQGSSIGIEIAHNDTEFYTALETAFNFDKRVLTEKALNDFIELNCAAFSSNGEIIISNVEKINYSKAYYDFTSKYLDTKVSREIPAKISNDLYDEIKNITYNIYKKFNLKGVIRIDFLVTKDEKTYVNEINTIPGSLAFYLFKNIVPHHKLISAIIEEGRMIFERQNSYVTSFESNFLVGFNEESLNRGVKK